MEELELLRRAEVVVEPVRGAVPAGSTSSRRAARPLVQEDDFDRIDLERRMLLDKLARARQPGSRSEEGAEADFARLREAEQFLTRLAAVIQRDEGRRRRQGEDAV